MTDDAKRVELHHLTDDRAEATDVAKDHPDIVARLTKLALDWKATLPKTAESRVHQQAVHFRKAQPAEARCQRLCCHARSPRQSLRPLGHEQGRLLTLDEYQAGLKGQENLEARFKTFDKNGDGKLTREEFVGPITQ